MKDYPVKCLYGEVSKVFATLQGVDFEGAFEKGFDNIVFETDTEGKITETSRIFNNKVRLSVAFCQYLWIFCKIGVILTDSDIVKESLDAMSDEEREAFEKEIELARRSDNLQLQGVREALYADSVLSRDKVLRTSYELVKYANEIKDYGASEESKDRLYEFIQDPIYSIGANGAYTYALAFMLLHEYSHFEIGHNQIKGPKSDELEADFLAFWNIYSEAKDERDARSAAIGMVCSLSTIAIWQGTWQETKEHPAITERIEKLLFGADIKPEFLVKIKHIVCYYIRIWALATNHDDLPNFIEGDLDKSFDLMFEYVKKH